MPFVGPGSTKTPADGSVDTAQLVDDAVTDPKLADGMVVQMVNVQDGTTSTGTTLFPIDTSTPQNTEGNEFMTLAITPKSTTNKLRIDVVASFTNTSANSTLASGLFQDSTADALTAIAASRNAGANEIVNIAFTHWMTAGTISETTFKVRGGASVAGTTTFNAGHFTGIVASSITITEIKAS